MTKDDLEVIFEVEEHNMEVIKSNGGPHKSVRLGSVLVLDEAGRYHQFMSRDGLQGSLSAFWPLVEELAAKKGGWIEAKQRESGDPTDIFFCQPIKSIQRYKT